MGDQRKIRGLGLGPVAPVFDFRAGEVRRQAEARGVAQILARATPPEVCGPDIPVSPARGGMRAFMPFEQVGNARIATGYRARGEDRPRQAVARLDVWDRMEAVAREVHARVEGAPAFVTPFTPAQVAMARAYRDLVERYDASGMRCSSGSRARHCACASVCRTCRFSLRVRVIWWHGGWKSAISAQPRMKPSRPR